MKKLLLVSTLLTAPAAWAPTAQAAPIFPAAGASTNGPAITITLTDTGNVITQNSNQTYDGSDDVEVALINNSSTTQTSIKLSGSSVDGGIFGFDGDGISNYIDANTGKLVPGNPADPSGYAGPGITFSNISSDQSSGEVDFSLAPGAYTYFSLEGSPSGIGNGGGIAIGGGTAVPEPASIALLGSLLLGSLLYRRKA